MRLLGSIAAVASSVTLCYGQENANNLRTYTISASGINASYIGYGARLTHLYVEDNTGVPRDIVLGYDTPSQYINDTENEHTYFGAVGKFCCPFVTPPSTPPRYLF